MSAWSHCSVRDYPPGGCSRQAGKAAGCAGHRAAPATWAATVGGEPVQTAAGPLVPHRGPQVRMGGGLLHTAQHLSMDEDEYVLTRDQELPTQLKRLSYRCEDIDTVIVTHLHEDHLGRLLSLRHAKVILSQPEWSRVTSWNARTRFLPFLAMDKLSPSVAGMATPQPVPFSSGPFPGFDRSQDLFGDGSVVLLPTPGHTPGHIAVLVRMDSYHILCTGDTLYTLRHLALDQVRPLAVSQKSWTRQADSIRRIQRLRHEIPSTVMAPAHDHTRYASSHLEPFLANGHLTPAELKAISTYEQRVFETHWELNGNALPEFVPPPDGGSLGSVREP
jgi:glyoxylase-like metal-dependent hydrolase (beta-lactamase superfamily II)